MFNKCVVTDATLIDLIRLLSQWIGIVFLLLKANSVILSYVYFLLTFGIWPNKVW